MFAGEALRKKLVFLFLSAAALCFGDGHLGARTAAFILHERFQSLRSSAGAPGGGAGVAAGVTAHGDSLCSVLCVITPPNSLRDVLSQSCDGASVPPI